MKTITLVDRSRIVARQECPRLRYLNYHYGGTGIEKVTMALPLINGIHVHAALADILIAVRDNKFDGDVLDALITEHISNYQKEVNERGIAGAEDLDLLVNEQSALIEGLIRGWVLTRLTALLAEYEIVSVEQEMQWEMAPGLIQMLRLDGLLRHRVSGLLFILEFKTVATPGYQWQLGWEKNIQFMSYTAAVKEITGEECGGVLVEGLVKGTRRKETAVSSPFCGLTIQNSPFCYAYGMKIKDTNDYLYQPEWSRGALKVLVPTRMPVKEWVVELQRNGLLENQFVSVPPISPLPEQILRWRRQTIAAETRFHMALAEVQKAEQRLEDDLQSGSDQDIDYSREGLEQLLDFHFPQHDNHCHRYGGACSFAEACFEPNIAEDPLGSGLYKRREPHHTTEQEQ